MRLSTSIYNTSEWKASIGSVYHTKTATTAGLKEVREATGKAPGVTVEHSVRYARGIRKFWMDMCTGVEENIF
jgi:hypothetical protein